MITITRHGDLGPVEAIELKDELTRVAHRAYRDVVLDLSHVDSLHPAAVAAIVSGARSVRSTTGSFRMIEPVGRRARRTLSLVSIATLLR